MELHNYPSDRSVTDNVSIDTQQAQIVTSAYYKRPSWIDRHYRSIMLLSMLVELLLLTWIAFKR